MPISVRSHLIAGTAALAVAGVTAVAPLPGLAQAVPTATTSSVAEVALTALNTPLQELLATINVGQSYLLSPFFDAVGALNWPGAGFDETGGDLLNGLLASQPALGKYTSVGILPQLVNQATPIIRQIQTNLLSYVTVALTGVTNWGIALNAGVWAFPPALVEAAELAFGGDIPAALQVIGDAIIDPISAATQALLGAGRYVLDSVVTRAAAVLESIPQIATTYVGAFIGGAGLLIERTATLATTWAAAIAGGDFAGAWNTAVAGLLGPSGLPGLALNLSIGAGVQTGPIVDPQTDLADNFVPSIRTAVQGTAWTLQNALATPSPTPPPAPLASVRAAAAEAPLSVAEVRADSTVGTDTAAVSTPAVESAGTPAETAEPTAAEAPAAPKAKQRVSRASAR